MAHKTPSKKPTQKAQRYYGCTNCRSGSCIAIAALTAANFLCLGLEIAGHAHWREYKRERNIDWFKEAFSIIHKTASNMWNNLQTRNALTGKRQESMHFLLAIHFLWKYKDEPNLCRFFDIQSPKTVQKYWKLYVPKISSLLEAKMGTLEENDDSLI
jgi:hypothetical protein